MITHSKSFRPDALRSLSNEFRWAGILLVVLHFTYVIGFIWFRNRKDSDLGIKYEDTLMNLLQINDTSRDNPWRPIQALAPLSLRLA